MKPSPELLAWLRTERARVGTKHLAAALEVPQPSLRRMLSTGDVGRLEPRIQRLRDELEDASTKGGIERDELEDAPPGGGIEVDEDELDELAELWGVTSNEVEDLLEVLDVDFDVMSLPEIAEYIDSFYEALEAQGWDGELSDLWDLYYGYVPGSIT